MQHVQQVHFWWSLMDTNVKGNEALCSEGKWDVNLLMLPAHQYPGGQLLTPNSQGPGQNLTSSGLAICLPKH